MRISEAKILIGVPFGQDTNKWITFESLSQQEDFFSQFAKYSFENLSFVKGFYLQKIQLEVYIENIIDCNYIMFKNNERWYYAYITDIEYISDSNTQVSFNIDWFQSYMHEIMFCDSPIERQIINKAEDYYENPLMLMTDPETDTSLNYVITQYWTKKFTDWKVAIYFKPNLTIDKIKNTVLKWVNTDDGGTTQENEDEVKYKVNIDEYKTGQQVVLNKVYNGSAVEYFNIASESDINSLTLRIQGLELLGYHIIDMVMIPTEMGNDTYKKEDFIVSQNPYWTDSKVLIDNYAPINTRMFFKPFIKLDVSNMQGQTQTYFYEKFYKLSLSNQPIFAIHITTLGGLNMTALPIGYNYYVNGDVPTDRVDEFDYGISINTSPKCIWNIDGFIQNLPSIAAKVGAAAFGNIAAATVIDQFAGKKRLSKAQKAEVAEARESFNESNERFKGSLKEGLTALKEGDIGGQTQNVTSALLQIVMNAFGIQFKKTVADPDTIRSIDNFYSMYGYYKNNKLEKLNILGRRRFNYVKSTNANVMGEIPVEARNYIISKLAQGVTFWHDLSNFDYGNFRGFYNNDDSGKDLTNWRIF